MSKKSRFRHSFDKQHGKRAQALLKSPSQHFYHIRWSMSSQFSWRTSFLLTCQILGLLVKTLAADEKYPFRNRDNLTIPIQMQLHQKKKNFFWIFCWNSESCNKIWDILKKKMNLIDFVFPKLRTPKESSEKGLKSLNSDDLSPSNMVNVPNHCRNLHHIISIIFTDHFQVNWLGKSLCFSHGKCSDCLLTHWLPMKRILFSIETI